MMAYKNFLNSNLSLQNLKIVQSRYYRKTNFKLKIIKSIVLFVQKVKTIKNSFFHYQIKTINSLRKFKIRSVEGSESQQPMAKMNFLSLVSLRKSPSNSHLT